MIMRQPYEAFLIIPLPRQFGTLQYGQAASQMFREFTITPANQTVSTPSSSAQTQGPSLPRSAVLMYLLAALTVAVT